MNRFQSILIISAITVIAAGNVYAAISPLKPGDTISKIEMVSLEGRFVSVHPPKDKLLLVSFLKAGDSNAVDAVKEPFVLYRRFHVSGLNVLCVYIDRSAESVYQLAETWGIPWPQTQGKTLTKIFRVKQTPARFLIGQKGKVLAVDLSGAKAHEVIANHLGVSLARLPIPDPPKPKPRAGRFGGGGMGGVGMGGMGMVMGGEPTLKEVVKKAGVQMLTPVKVPLFVKTGKPTIQIMQKNSGAQFDCGWYQKQKQHRIFRSVNGPMAKKTIRPGAEPFGIYIKVLYGKNYQWFTDEKKNNGEQHTRVYPLKKPNAYLLAWEDMPIGTMDDDFQDIIVRLENVKPYNPEKPVDENASAVFTKKEAIEAIGVYGGFIEYDEKGGVKKINLVYGKDTTGQRIECPNLTDSILNCLTAFPELQELLIHKTQASDRMMPMVGRLTNLKKLIMWEARVSDAGVSFLKDLKNLETIHIGNSPIGDPSLAILAKLPKLDSLALQRNNFTDEGLKHLKDAAHIKVLWVGFGGKGITDQGIEHLLNLKNLELLDLQGAAVTDEGILRLKDLVNLKKLYLDETAVTEEGKKALEKEISGIEIRLD